MVVPRQDVLHAQAEQGQAVTLHGLRRRWTRPARRRVDVEGSLRAGDHRLHDLHAAGRPRDVTMARREVAEHREVEPRVRDRAGALVRRVQEDAVLLGQRRVVERTWTGRFSGGHMDPIDEGPLHGRTRGGDLAVGELAVPVRVEVGHHRADLAAGEDELGAETITLDRIRAA